jgi:hypothetical protein
MDILEVKDTSALPPLSQLSGSTATITEHCAGFGRLTRAVRKFSVSRVIPFAQYDKAVHVIFSEPKERREYSYTIVPDDILFLTIHVDGKIVYDSRNDVPLDAEKFMERYNGSKQGSRYECHFPDNPLDVE